MRLNLKSQIVTKQKNLNCEKKKEIKVNIDETNLKKNSKIQKVTKLNN